MMQCGLWYLIFSWFQVIWQASTASSLGNFKETVFKCRLNNLVTYPILRAAPLSSVTIIMTIICSSSGDAVTGDVHTMQPHAGAAAGGLKGVWLELMTVMSHGGAGHAECAHCMLLSWKRMYWFTVSETSLDLFPRRLVMEPQHKSLSLHQKQA